jgi:Putative DNA-binding domain
MAVRLHRLTSRLGADFEALTVAHMQALCENRIPEDVDLDFKSQDEYTTTGNDGLDELAKDVTALANARGGLIVVGIDEDSQGCAESLCAVPVSDKKVNQMYSGLRARVVPYLRDVSIHTLEQTAGAGEGFVLIAVSGSALAPHAVRMTSRPQYSFARRVGRTTAWLEESEIAALYRDRFRLAEEHRDKVIKVLESGAEWTRKARGGTSNPIWLELALVPSVPAERFVDADHIHELSKFFRKLAEPGNAPSPSFKSLIGQTPAVLRGRLRLESLDNNTALEAYADGRVYARTLVGWPRGQTTAPWLNFTLMEFWLLVLLHAAAAYADWAGAYGDVDVLANLTGPATIVPDLQPLAPGNYMSFPDTRDRSDTAPVHTTSTLDALAGDGSQLHACARRIATDFLADLGRVDTTLLKPGGRMLTARLDQQARIAAETWMREVDLPVDM